jgi:hypothetical protein
MCIVSKVWGKHRNDERIKNYERRFGKVEETEHWWTEAKNGTVFWGILKKQRRISWNCTIIHWQASRMCIMVNINEYCHPQTGFEGEISQKDSKERWNLLLKSIWKHSNSLWLQNGFSELCEVPYFLRGCWQLSDSQPTSVWTSHW